MTRARARDIIGRQLLAGMIGLLIVTVDACYETARRRHPILRGKVGRETDSGVCFHLSHFLRSRRGDFLFSTKHCPVSFSSLPPKSLELTETSRQPQPTGAPRRTDQPRANAIPGSSKPRNSPHALPGQGPYIPTIASEHLETHPPAPQKSIPNRNSQRVESPASKHRPSQFHHQQRSLPQLQLLPFTHLGQRTPQAQGTGTRPHSGETPSSLLPPFLLRSGYLDLLLSLTRLALLAQHILDTSQTPSSATWYLILKIHCLYP